MIGGLSRMKIQTCAKLANTAMVAVRQMQRTQILVAISALNVWVLVSQSLPNPSADRKRSMTLILMIVILENEMNMNVHFSSATELWSTPQDFFDKYDAIYQFKTDVCATIDNAKCDLFYDIARDGLLQDWRGSCWMNPPYGRTIKAWMKKAYEASLNGATVVCLVPARTDTAWWHDYAIKGDIEFIRGRLKFGVHKNSAPFPSAVVVFRGATQ